MIINYSVFNQKNHNMASLGFGNSVYDLTRDEINQNVKETTGNYSLGFYKKKKDNEQLAFHPKYVGSSFTDLKREIIQQGLELKVKDDGTPEFTHFKFSHNPNTPIKAFKKECENYHDFEQFLVNERHPKRPEDYTPDNLKCPKDDCKQ